MPARPSVPEVTLIFDSRTSVPEARCMPPELYGQYRTEANIHPEGLPQTWNHLGWSVIVDGMRNETKSNISEREGPSCAARGVPQISLQNHYMHGLPADEASTVFHANSPYESCQMPDLKQRSNIVNQQSCNPVHVSRTYKQDSTNSVGMQTAVGIRSSPSASVQQSNRHCQPSGNMNLHQSTNTNCRRVPHGSPLPPQMQHSTNVQPDTGAHVKQQFVGVQNVCQPVAVQRMRVPFGNLPINRQPAFVHEHTAAEHARQSVNFPQLDSEPRMLPPQSTQLPGGKRGIEQGECWNNGVANGMSLTCQQSNTSCFQSESRLASQQLDRQLSFETLQQQQQPSSLSPSPFVQQVASQQLSCGHLRSNGADQLCSVGSTVQHQPLSVVNASPAASPVATCDCCCSAQSRGSLASSFQQSPVTEADAQTLRRVSPRSRESYDSQRRRNVCHSISPQGGQPYTTSMFSVNGDTAAQISPGNCCQKTECNSRKISSDMQLPDDIPQLAKRPCSRTGQPTCITVSKLNKVLDAVGHKSETVDSLLSAICEPSLETDVKMVTVSSQSQLYNSSGSNDSGLPVNDTSSNCSCTPLRRHTEGADMVNVEGTSWTVRQQLALVMADECDANFTSENYYQATQQSGAKSAMQCLPSQFENESNLQKQTCSVAVNTSICWPPFPAAQYEQSVTSVELHETSAKTSPFNAIDEDCLSESIHQRSANSACRENGLNRKMLSPDGLVLERTNDDQRDVEQNAWISGGEVEGSLINQGFSTVDDSYYTPPMPLYMNPSEESVASEMIVDMVEYESPSPEK